MMKQFSPSQMPWHSKAPLFLAVLAPLLLIGCAKTYAMKGKVIQGPTAMVMVVSASDPRLKEDDPSGAGAVIEAIFEPNNGIDRRSLGRVMTDSSGYFELPVDEVGAGFLEYETMIIARREGFQGAANTVPIPTRRQRLLITLPRGVDTLRLPENFLDQTLRDAKPYLDD